MLYTAPFQSAGSVSFALVMLERTHLSPLVAGPNQMRGLTSVCRLPIGRLLIGSSGRT